SVGRGTDTPFELFGAPWIDARRLAAELNAAGLAGVRFVPVYFTPQSSKFAGERCGGVNVLITNRDVFEPLETGFSIAATLRKLYADHWDMSNYGRLLCSDKVLTALRQGASAQEIVRLCRPDVEEFRARRREVLLYQ